MANILNIPFDESAQSAKAYDYSNNRYDGSVVGAAFVHGRKGNCLEFTGEGHCDVESNVIDFSSDFTLTCWVKRLTSPDGWSAKKLIFNVTWEAVNGYYDNIIELDEQWTFLAVSKQGLHLNLYKNGALIVTYTLPMQPKGFSFSQDDYATSYGHGDVSELKIFNSCLSASEILAVQEESTKLQYFLEGKEFVSTWDLYVSESNGLLDRPKMKEPLKIDWQSEHGQVVDLNNKRLDARTITLSCFMKAEGKEDFIRKVNDFLSIFNADGTQRLQVNVKEDKPLVYEVYNEDGTAIDKKWNDSLMVGTFSLKLVEPQPVKRVLRHQMTGSFNATCTVTLTSNKPLTIYWGDGAVSYDIYGTAVTATHTYTSNGIYYPIVAGVIEKVTDFSTNAIIVWSRL
jgi:hypothetical protein